MLFFKKVGVIWQKLSIQDNQTDIFKRMYGTVLTGMVKSTVLY